MSKEMIESDILLFFDKELITINTSDTSNSKSKGMNPKKTSITTKPSQNGTINPNISTKKSDTITILFFIF